MAGDQVAPQGASQEGACSGFCKLFTFLNLCRLMRFLGVLTTLAIAVMYALMCKDYIEWMEDMDKAGNGDEIKTRDVMNVLSLIFQTLLALLLAAFCSEAQGLLLYFAAFHNWMCLGLGFMYLGISTFSELSGRAAYDGEDLEDAIEITAWISIGVGAAYFILGLFGGKAMRASREKKAAKK